MDLFEKVKPRLSAESIFAKSAIWIFLRPIRELKRIADHCELSWTKEYEHAVRKQYVRSENQKWKQDLTPAQQEILEEVLRPHLIKYGYEPRDTSKQTGPPEVRSANHVSV